jgi:hypothetical protein
MHNIQIRCKLGLHIVSSTNKILPHDITEMLKVVFHTHYGQPFHFYQWFIQNDEKRERPLSHTVAPSLGHSHQRLSLLSDHILDTQ